MLLCGAGLTFPEVATASKASVQGKVVEGGRHPPQRRPALGSLLLRVLLTYGVDDGLLGTLRWLGGKRPTVAAAGLHKGAREGGRPTLQGETMGLAGHPLYLRTARSQAHLLGKPLLSLRGGHCDVILALYRGSQRPK